MSPQQTVDASQNVEKHKNVKNTRRCNRQAEKAFSQRLLRPVLWALRLQSIKPEGPYNVAQRMPLSSALRFLGVWSGPMALAGSRPVYVCLQTIFCLNSGAFLSDLLHILYPDQGVVWRSIQSVFTRLFTHFLLSFPPSRICASVC